MTPKHSEYVIDLFASTAVDRTPDAARNAASLLYAPFLRDAEITRSCSFILSETELQRAGRFVKEDDQDHFIQRRAIRRYCGGIATGSPHELSKIYFDETDKARPYLPDRPELWFSFSSCRFGFLGAWSSTHAVGVDIEDTTRSVEPLELAERYFSKAEAAAIERENGPARLKTFFQLWCLKEAALKSIGEGLPFGLDAFEFELTPSLRLLNAPDEYGDRERFDLHLIEDENACAALVIRDNT